MAFFARPNLDNTQFKQLIGGEPLTLSGQTQIATTSGLTLIGDAGTGAYGSGGMYIPIIATGASNNFVLTYDSTQKAIVLKQSSASGATGIYDGASPTTCTVGGLTAGTSIFNDPIVSIIQCMVAPTLYPVPIVLPYTSSINLCCFGTSTLMNTLYEVGSSLSIMSNTKYCGGNVPNVYSGNSSCSGGLPFEYVYNMFGNPDVTCTCANPIAETRVGNDPPTYNTLTVGYPNNTVSVYIKYCSGATIYDSSGTYYTGVTSGCTDIKTKNISGIYPYYWGKVTCAGIPSGSGRPNGACIKKDITGGTATKVVGLSNATLNITFGSTADDYIWFAIPSNGGVQKTCWYVDALNNQPITGPVNPGGCLFPAYNASTDLITGVTSNSGCWTGQSYQVYVSNYQSAASVNMQLRNS